MTRQAFGAAPLTLRGLGALQQARELATRHTPGYDFKRVDGMLARCRLVMELAQDTSVGPIVQETLVVIRDGEYQDMADVAFHAKLYTLAAIEFDFMAFIPQLNRMAVAVGLGPYQIGGPK